MLKELTVTSVVAKLLKRIYSRYCNFETWVEGLNKGSLFFKIIRNSCYKLTVCARHSFLGKITEMNVAINSVVLEESSAVRCLMDTFNGCKYRITFYLKDSVINSLIKEATEAFRRLPVRRASIIMIIAVFTDSTLSILFKREIMLAGWLIRAALLFTGFNGLRPDLKWNEISKTSFFLKLMNNPCKNRNLT